MEFNYWEYISDILIRQEVQTGKVHEEVDGETNILSIKWDNFKIIVRR